MKLKQLILLSFCYLTAFTSMAQVEIIDKVIAQVGGELVLLSEVEEQLAMLRANGETLPPDAKCYLLDQVMTQKLLVNQAKLDSIPITDEEVEAQLSARVEQILEYMGGNVRQFEEYYGQTVNEVKDNFREDLRSQLLADRMQQQILNTTTVTPREVREFFATIPQDSLPYFNAEVEIGELVLKPVVSTLEKEKARTELEELRRQIVEEGADFAELAQKNSDDFGSGRLGGDLGWAKRGKFVPEFEAAAYKLDKDEISPVFESPFGFHILQMLERRGNQIHTRHILIKPELMEADFARTERKLDSIRQLILQDSLDFGTAVKRFGYDEIQSYNNDGRMVNQRSGNTFFEIADLDPDIYFSIDTMQLMSVSQPFYFTGPDGERYYRIVQLQSETVPHVANLKEDYTKIKDAAKASKQNIYIAEWVEKTINSTYIQIDPMFRKCVTMQRWTKDKL